MPDSGRWCSCWWHSSLAEPNYVPKKQREASVQSCGLPMAGNIHRRVSKKTSSKRNTPCNLRYLPCFGNCPVKRAIPDLDRGQHGVATKPLGMCKLCHGSVAPLEEK